MVVLLATFCSLLPSFLIILIRLARLLSSKCTFFLVLRCQLDFLNKTKGVCNVLGKTSQEQGIPLAEGNGKRWVRGPPFSRLARLPAGSAVNASRPPARGVRLSPEATTLCGFPIEANFATLMDWRQHNQRATTSDLACSSGQMCYVVAGAIGIERRARARLARVCV